MIEKFDNYPINIGETKLKDKINELIEAANHLEKLCIDEEFRKKLARNKLIKVGKAFKEL